LEASQHVIYRAMLTGTTTVSTVELTSLAHQWIGVIVQSNKLIMDSTWWSHCTGTLYLCSRWNVGICAWCESCTSQYTDV